MSFQRMRVRMLTLSAILGMLGVFSGYALFVLVREQLESGRGRSFLLAVLVAGTMSFAIEWVRDLIRSGHEEPLRFSRVVVTIFTLMMFEIFVIALHEIPTWRLADVSDLPHQLLGTAADAGGHPLANLFLLTGIWFVAGAVLAATLSNAIFSSHQNREAAFSMPRQIAFSARRGISGGAISAPLAAIATVILLRILIISRLYFFAHNQWRESMRGLVVYNGATWGTNPFSGGTRLALTAFLWLDSLWRGWTIGPLLTIAAYIVVIWALVKTKSPGWLILILALAGAVVLFQPLLHDLKALFAIPLLAALVWSIPGLVLGALSPLLRRPSELPREWGILACVAAGVLLLTTWSRFEWWWIFPAALLAIAIVYFRRGVSVEEYWPLVALSVAIIVAGATSLIQHISFAGVLLRLHEVNSLPAYVIEKPKPMFEIPPWKLLPNNDLFNPQFNRSKVLDLIGNTAPPTSRPFSLLPTTWTLDLPLSSAPGIGLGRFAATQRALNISDLIAEQAKAQPLKVSPTTTPASRIEMPGPGSSLVPPTVSRLGVDEQAKAGDDGEKAKAETKDVGSEMSPDHTARLLEICLSAAFAFWCTVAMLATWAMLRAGEQPLSGEDQTGEPSRHDHISHPESVIAQS